MKSNKKDAVIVSSYVDGRLKKIARAQHFSDSELWEIGFNQKLGSSAYKQETIERLIKLKEDMIIELQHEISLLKESLPKIAVIKSTTKKEKEYYCLQLDDKDTGPCWIPESTYRENPSNYRLLKEV